MRLMNRNIKMLRLVLQYLRAAGRYESREEALLREEVLGCLDEVVNLCNRSLDGVLLHHRSAFRVCKTNISRALCEVFDSLLSLFSDHYQVKVDCCTLWQT